MNKFERFGRAFGGTTSEEAVYEELVRLTADLLGADMCLAAIVKDGVFHRVASNPSNIDWPDSGQSIESTLPGLVYSQQKSCVIDDVREVRSAASASNNGPFSVPGGTDERPIRAVVAAPIGDFGVIVAGSREPDDFSESDRELVVELASLATGALAAVRGNGRREPDQLEKLARTLSHDMKSPLNIAIGRIELAIRSGEIDDLPVAIDALERIREMADDLAWLARADERIEAKENVSLHELVEIAWNNVESQSATLNIDGSVEFLASKSTACQILENLLSNAVTHGGDDSVIRIGTLSDGFYVEDDGPGIPPSIRQEVLQWGVSYESTGSGLGLAIANEIAEAHGWELTITESQEGGARIEISGVETVHD